MSAAPVDLVAAVCLVAKPVQKRDFEISMGCTASKNKDMFLNTSRQEIIAGSVLSCACAGLGGIAMHRVLQWEAYSQYVRLLLVSWWLWGKSLCSDFFSVRCK